MTKISFIKIIGPPILKAIHTLQKIAVDMPEVCIMDHVIAGLPELPQLLEDPQRITNYYKILPIATELTEERCNTIISKSGQKLGEYDFFFEWFTGPSAEQLNALIEKIDTALEPLGCGYTITTLS